jgi:hypothetical protein
MITMVVEMEHRQLPLQPKITMAGVMMHKETSAVGTEMEAMVETATDTVALMLATQAVVPQALPTVLGTMMGMVIVQGASSVEQVKEARTAAPATALNKRRLT